MGALKVRWFFLVQRRRSRYGGKILDNRQRVFELHVSLCYRPLTQFLFASLEITMRLLRYFLLLVTLLGIQAPGRAQASGDLRLSITKDVMDDIAHDRLASVRERFTPDLRDSFSESEMKGVWNDLVEVAGAFQKQISQTTRTVQDTPVYVAKSQFEKFKVELKLVFNDSNQIIDFWIGAISDLSPESMEASAREITDLLRQGHFDQVSSKFDDLMKTKMSPERLVGSWSHIMTHLGQFKGIKLARKDSDLDRVDVRCEFENGLMIIRVAFDPSGKIDGLWMLPAEPEKDSQI